MIWPLSNRFLSQTWTVWTKQGTVISDVTGNNRAVIKTFTAYQLFELLIGCMGHVCFHVAQLNSLIHFFLCEHAKLLTDSLDHIKYLANCLSVRYGTCSAVPNQMSLDIIFKNGRLLTNIKSAVKVTKWCSQ